MQSGAIQRLSDDSIQFAINSLNWVKKKRMLLNDEKLRNWIPQRRSSKCSLYLRYESTLLMCSLQRPDTPGKFAI